jgi:hypothetical protein
MYSDEVVMREDISCMTGQLFTCEPRAELYIHGKTHSYPVSFIKLFERNGIILGTEISFPMTIAQEVTLTKNVKGAFPQSTIFAHCRKGFSPVSSQIDQLPSHRIDG